VPLRKKCAAISTALTIVIPTEKARMDPTLKPNAARDQHGIPWLAGVRLAGRSSGVSPSTRF
jgi:hypothetical protein